MMRCFIKKILSVTTQFCILQFLHISYQITCRRLIYYDILLTDENEFLLVFTHTSAQTTCDHTKGTPGYLWAVPGMPLCSNTLDTQKLIILPHTARTET